MRNRALISSALIGSLALAPLCGCSNLPGSAKEQGAVIGGVGGVLAGAAIGNEADDNVALGALIGGVVGAGGGYLIGAQKDKIDRQRRQEAEAAHRRAEQNPARAQDVEKARTADLNEDGFVTLDEVVAMERANLSDREMVERLRRTGQVFELTDEQERYLEDRGVSHNVVLELRRMGPQRDTDLARTASAASSADGGGDDYHSRVARQSDTERRRTGDRDRPRDFQWYRQSDRVTDSERF